MGKGLIITGMHRSHTSYVAECMYQAGLEMGDRLIAGNAYNPHGHFEDQEVVALHESIITKHRLISRWKGVKAQKIRDFVGSEAEYSQARKIINRLHHQEGLLECDYGWKDPRGALFLSFWNEIMPSAYYVFVVRHPMQCINSLIRRSKNKSKIKIHPLHATAMFNYWDICNERILSFYRRCPEKCIIIDAMRHVQSNELETKFNHRLKEDWGFDIQEIDLKRSFDPLLTKSDEVPFYLRQLYRRRKNTKEIYQSLMQLHGD